MDRDAVIEKIKKLLRMKRGGTPGEIENALAMAAELARKHSIDLASVDPEEKIESERLVHFQDIMKTRLPLEAKLAGYILTKFFNVAIVVQRCACFNRRLYRMERRWLVNLIGTEWDCKVAQYIFVFLQQAFRRAWNQRENRRLKKREAFLQGVYIGLAARLEREQEQQATGECALLVINRALQLRDEYLKAKFPNLETHTNKLDRSAPAATYAGALAGQRIQIRRGLNGSTPAPARSALPPARPAAVEQLTLI